MFGADTIPYPMQDEIYPDEDGIGFALRMAIANGLTFNDLARRLASPGHIYLPSKAARAIAFMFGATPRHVERAFVHRYFRGGCEGARFLGQTFLRPYHLKPSRPQICPLCIEQRSRADAVWTIALVTCCPIHHIRLMDRCICGRAVKWRRPSIDFCECGRRLVSSDQRMSPVTSAELAVTSQIYRILHSSTDQPSYASEFSSTFDDISMDTFLRLVWAFGILDEQRTDAHPRSANRVFTTPEAADIVCRASDRISSLIRSPSPFRHVRVCEMALASLYDDVNTAADQYLVTSLLKRIAPSSTSAIRGTFRIATRQLTLFGD